MCGGVQRCAEVCGLVWRRAEACRGENKQQEERGWGQCHRYRKGKEKDEQLKIAETTRKELQEEADRTVRMLEMKARL